MVGLTLLDYKRLAAKYEARSILLEMQLREAQKPTEDTMPVHDTDSHTTAWQRLVAHQAARIMGLEEKLATAEEENQRRRETMRESHEAITEVGQIVDFLGSTKELPEAVREALNDERSVKHGVLHDLGRIVGHYGPTAVQEALKRLGANKTP